jgi:hypothetical protein
MRTDAISINPFSLMMEPEVVLKAMQRSQTLRGLRRHQLRPLDKPLIPFANTPITSNGRERVAPLPSQMSDLDD